MAFAIISRDEARAQGLKRFFTGEPCIYGHIAERQTVNTKCMECQRLKARREYTKRDKDVERERLRKWKAANREKVNARSREANKRPETKARKAAWYQVNKDRVRPERLARYAEQRDDRVAYSKAWAEANPERYAEHMRIAARKRRARKKGSVESHTTADLKEILTAQGFRCAYCRADLKRVKKHVDHIIPLARGGSNGRANLQYLCAPCNQSKNARDPIEYAQSIGLLL